MVFLGRRRWGWGHVRQRMTPSLGSDSAEATVPRRADNVFVCSPGQAVEGGAQRRSDSTVSTSESAMASISTRVVLPVAREVSSTSPSARARGPIVTR